MKKAIVALLLLFGFTVTAQKQGQDRLDSLLSILRISKSDTAKLKLLADLSFGYSIINPDSGIMFGQDLLKLANRLKNKKYIGNSYLVLGVNYIYKSDFAMALNYNLKALDVFEQAGDKRSMAKPMNNIGIIYFNQNDLDKALQFYSKALKVYNDLEMKYDAATTLGNMGLVYQSKNQIEKALESELNALAIFRDMNDLSGIARMLGNTGNLFDIKLDYTKALKNKHEALSIYQKLGDLNGTAKILDNLAYSYLHIVLDKDKIQIPDSLKDRNSSLQKAISFLLMAIDINQKLGSLTNLKENFEGLSNVYIEKKDFEKAFEYFNKSVRLKDSIFSEENQRNIKAIELKKSDEIKKKEMEVKNIQLENAKREKWFYFMGMLAFLGFSFLVYRNYVKQKHTNKLLSFEKKKSDDLLLNILPEEVANELKKTGESVARQYNHVSVLFTDFVNFTGISEQMSPEELVQVIHKYFTAFDAIIEKYGLEKIKTIGDAYLAVCGLPIEVSDHAQRAVEAAIEIQQYIADNDSKFQIRIGVHSGPVVAGIVGVKKYAYDIWGDTVNTAARMEQNSKPGKINISGATYGLIQEKFTCQYRGKIDAKNKGAIDMYFVEVEI